MLFSKRYQSQEEELKYQQYWQDRGLYAFSPADDKPVYAIDTPPPTVSGEIHLGHVFSYVQAEVIARYWRMMGHAIYYPFGFDDNGLPTERFVEKNHNIRAGDMERQKFIELCLQSTAETEIHFEHFWKRLGFSVDWSEHYSTISPLSQRISQRSFIELYRAGLIYRKASPSLWCSECQTAIAQAELENEERPSTFYDLRFRGPDDDVFTIATTRPELLPAIVAVFMHPEDVRYRHLKGRELTDPLFQRTVPVLEDWRVLREKGTGLVMCCTFGDMTDIEWYQEYGLPARIIIDKGGTLKEAAGPFAGLSLQEARKAIIAYLRHERLIDNERAIEHSVNCHERCGSEIDYRITSQWFIKVLESKERFIAAADEIHWYPEYMKTRYLHWVKNLKWDWCISRQRYFGVPFPLWYCNQCGEIKLAEDNELPLDPSQRQPASNCSCGGREFLPETDIMDTWATSSLTPFINGKWGERDDRMDKIYPMALRPQAHDIIRTWTFYTIVKGLYHTGTVPWKSIMISGHGLDPQRRKISKSRGNGQQMETPLAAIEKHSADTIRYWACSSKIGSDTFFSEETVQIGKKLVTKLWNAAKFVAPHLEISDEKVTTYRVIDRWLLAGLQKMAGRAHNAYQEHEPAIAKDIIERFFRDYFCDHYLEFIKIRLYQKRDYSASEQNGARETLRMGLFTQLQLLAPVVPHITEAIYQRLFAGKGQSESIHSTLLPIQEQSTADEHAFLCGELSLPVISGFRKLKTSLHKTPGTPCRIVRIHCSDEQQQRLEEVAMEIRDINQAEQCIFCEEADSSMMWINDMAIAIEW